MVKEELRKLLTERKTIVSPNLGREVIIDFYLPKNIRVIENLNLLLINDGQDLPKMPFSNMLDDLLTAEAIHPLLCVGIHCSADRRNEYATAGRLDYAGRGTKAPAYRKFILEELLPFIEQTYQIPSFKQKAFAGFSLGGLNALDTVWYHPDIFTIAGIFSGSLWWRSKPLGTKYRDDRDRIMPQQIRSGKYRTGLKFYFTTGSLDETADRNNNGIIDSIDDTLAVIEELKKKGYGDADIQYVNFPDGRHDVPTWARALPDFLRWGWGTGSKVFG